MTSNSIYQEFTPTYLYIKQHTVTGKLYFGKTIHNPEKYLGSGLRWQRHIKKHGKEHVVNLWYELFICYEDFINFATMFSHKMGIVESDSWLNIIPENGVGGSVKGKNNPAYGKPRSLSTKHKLSIVLKGKPSPRYSKSYPNVSAAKAGKNNPMYGKTLSESTLQKMRGPRGPQKIKVRKVQCDYCGFIGNPGAMSRFHFNNCKHKN